MRTPKISPTLPDRMIINGRKLVRKAVYEGSLLQITPELKAEITKIEREIHDLEIETYNVQKINSMFITNRKKQYNMRNLINNMGTDIEILRRKLKALKQKYLAAQNSDNLK